MNGVDTTRLERFRQLRKEIRGSNEHLIVGIDVAKDNHHAFFGTAWGSSWRIFSFILFLTASSRSPSLISK
jgi:hypothetical protein